ncbi:MAG: aspartate carbamoyltransferase catalytic subunit [Clostridia bacterium]|nr:aspartate carbamoyltransferase catalytic subunit [Clostridia bacterium]MBO7156114.1 aspartate carbamoyltransferase catalytic subunit [Clostridia bacterium]
MRGLLTLRTLSSPEIMEIIELAIRFKKGWTVNFPGKKMVNLFYENSTRTQYSFQMAMINLGITPVSFNLAGSSVAKGETLYDTVRTFESLGVDGVVIRHSQDVYYRDLETIKVPIFNGGDGSSDHPTQTLLDLMTIYEEFGRFEGLKIALIGDIAHSRVAHGNAEVMKRLGMKVYVSGPEQFADSKTGEYIEMDKAVETCDIINLLRVQFERHEEEMQMTKEEYHAKYGMTVERVAKMKKNAIIMHPAPINRGIEIASEVAECDCSRIYKQMENGVYVRMAVITLALQGKL